MENENLPIQVQESHPVQLSAQPEVVLQEATRAAKALQSVIKQKTRKLVFQGKQYLEYEDWLLLGQFYGFGAETGDSQHVEIDGVQGAKATAIVRNFKTGEIVGGATAYCMRDERNWEHKPWFQLASMAQTRAGAKALRNRMAWVAVLAGYAPTPYEEMEQTPTESHQTHQDSILGGETQKGRGRGRPAKNPPKIENTDKLSKETLAMAYTMMGSEAEAVEFILNQSTFQSEKTGELIKAKSLDHLAKSQKWLQSTYGRVREEYEAWQKTQNPPQESEEEYLQNQ